MGIKGFGAGSYQNNNAIKQLYSKKIISMATSIVKVYNSRYGQWEENAKVVLGWNGFINLGMSRPFYTNSNGVAILEHTATGEAEIYVN